MIFTGIVGLAAQDLDQRKKAQGVRAGAEEKMASGGSDLEDDNSESKVGDTSPRPESGKAKRRKMRDTKRNKNWKKE
jgi:hypothetical protein